MKGAFVFSTLLFIFGFVSLVASVFIILNKENTGVKVAEEQITKMLLDLSNLYKEIEGIKKMNEIANKVNREEYEKVVAANLKQSAENEKLHQKINWLEIKMSAIPKNTTQTLILKQEEPLKVKMLYKKVGDKDKRPPSETTKKLVEIKKKMDEINRK
jgi:BMFP domain-containing protein YqiC